MMKNVLRVDRRTLWIIGALLCIIIFHVIVNFLWLSQNHINDAVDVFPHLNNQRILSSQLKQLLQENNMWSILRMPRISVHIGWPTMVYLVSELLMVFFPQSPFWFIFINGIFFLGCTIVSTFCLGKYLYGYSVGLFAAFFISVCPAVYGFSRLYGIVLPVVAVMPICMLYYYRCLHKRTFTDGLLFAVSAGIAFIFMPAAIFFLLAPMLLLSIKIIKIIMSQDGDQKKKTIVLQYVFCAIVFIFISAFWWYGNAGNIIHNYVYYSFDSSGQISTSLSNPSVVLHYLFYIISLPLHMPFILPVLVLLLFFFMKKKEWGILSVWFMPPFIFYSLMFQQKWANYLFPAYPVLCILCSALLC